MNTKQLERAAYIAAHAILSANTSAPHLATPGGRRSYTVDVIAEKIRSVFELHCSALDESTDWWVEPVSIGRAGAAPRELGDAERTTLKQLQPVMQKLH